MNIVYIPWITIDVESIVPFTLFVTLQVYFPESCAEAEVIESCDRLPL